MASEGGTARRRNVHSSNSRGVQGSDETQHPAPSRTQSDGFEYVDQGEFGDAAFQSYFQDAELEEAPSGMKRSRSIEKLTKMLTDVMREEVHRSVSTVDDLVNSQFQRVDRLVHSGTKSVKGTLKKVSRFSKERQRRVAKRMRRIITGDANRRVRDHLKAELAKPLHVKLIDKISFTGGIGFVLFSQYVFLVHPLSFPLFYAICIVPLLIIRYFLYKSRKWQYFLVDYCYSVNALYVVHYFFFRDSAALAQVLFAAANGPLAAAIVAWCNSLVFHSLDKTTSLIIHMFPALVSYCYRWLPAEHVAPCVRPDCSFGWHDAFTYPVIMYLCWQALYTLQTEFIDREKLEADPNISTSLRYFTSHRSALRDGALKLCRIAGWFGPKEEFNGHELKTKIVFVTSQLVYTLATLLPISLLWSSKVAHMWYLIAIFMASAWNGAGYYIEVFSVRYHEALDMAIKKHEASHRSRSESAGSTESETNALLDSTLRSHDDEATATEPASAEGQQRGINTPGPLPPVPAHHQQDHKTEEDATE